MLASLFLPTVGRLERRFGVRLDHLRDIVRTSPAAFCKLLLLGPLAQHRRRLPRNAFHLARLAATQTEGCGSCVQIAAYEARRDRVDDALLAAILREDDAALPADLRTVVAFARTVARGADDPERRAELRRHYGEAAVVELALVIATARVFPTLKRALGHAGACQRPAAGI